MPDDPTTSSQSKLSFRRAFIQRTAALSTLAAQFPLSTPALLASENSKSKLVDTHLHCFAGSEDPRFPYHARAPYRPTAVASPEQLLRCMDEAEVAYAVVVHPESYQDDHRYLEHCLEVGNGRLKGTCLVFADRPHAAAKLRDLSTRLPIVAARVHAYAPGRLPPFGQPELRDLWKVAADLGLAVQLHFEPRYAPGFEPLIREFSDTTVIIDHLGRPFQGTPQEHAVVVKWAELPNTVIKLSSIPATTSYPHRDPSQVILQLSRAFGPERMLYGGGFNSEATGTSYQAAFETARRYLPHLSAAEQNLVLGGNAMKLFNFGRES